MAKKRKGQGLPITVIIIAILVLIVLVVVIAIFTGNFGKFSKDIQSCALKGGDCKYTKCQEGEREIDATCDKTKGIYCCVKVIG